MQQGEPIINGLYATKIVKNPCCPHLEQAQTSICHAKPGAITTPNGYELNYHCLTGDTRSVLYIRDTTVREGTMNCNAVERRKYPRFKAAIPVSIGLIALKGGNTTHVQLKGITTDISMKGLGLELNYAASEMLPFAAKLMGENKQFDLEFNANLGNTGVRGIGEVRWISMGLPYFFRIGVFLK